jgi:hypothetical protein
LRIDFGAQPAAWGATMNPPRPRSRFGAPEDAPSAWTRTRRGSMPCGPGLQGFGQAGHPPLRWSCSTPQPSPPRSLDPASQLGLGLLAGQSSPYTAAEPGRGCAIPNGCRFAIARSRNRPGLGGCPFRSCGGPSALPPFSRLASRRRAIVCSSASPITSSTSRCRRACSRTRRRSAGSRPRGDRAAGGSRPRSGRPPPGRR